MKIKFKILVPQRLEMASGYDTIINFDPESPAKDKNSRELYGQFKNEYFSPASGSGFDFEKTFAEFGLNVSEYVQISAYSVSKISAIIIAKEAKKWSNYVQCLFPQGSLKEYFKDKPVKHEILVYEWMKKDRSGKSIILFGPKEEEQDLNLMYSKTIFSEVVELPSEAALEYFTANSIFVLKKNELREIFDALLGEKMSPEFKEAIENFKEGVNFGMWGMSSIENRFDFDPDMFPWSRRVLMIQNKIKEILSNPKLCFFKKYKETKKILRSI